jgi:hypothetical protein
LAIGFVFVLDFAEQLVEGAGEFGNSILHSNHNSNSNSNSNSNLIS